MQDFLLGLEGTPESQGHFTVPWQYRVQALRPVGYLTCLLASLLRAGARRIRLQGAGKWLRLESDAVWPLEDLELKLGLEASPGFRWRGKVLEVRVKSDWRGLIDRYAWAPVEVQVEGQILNRPLEMPDCLLGRRLVGPDPAEWREEAPGLWNQEVTAAFSGLLGLGRRVHTAFTRPPDLILLVDGLRINREVDLGLPDATAVVWGTCLRRSHDGLDVVEDFRYHDLLRELRWHFRDMLPELARQASTSALRRLAAPVLQFLAATGEQDPTG